MQPQPASISAGCAEASSQDRTQPLLAAGSRQQNPVTQTEVRTGTISYWEWPLQGWNTSRIKTVELPAKNLCRIR
jgi:hypothetical protein